MPAVDLTVRDLATGAGVAQGSTVYLFPHDQLSPIDSAPGIDSLHIDLGWDRHGEFDIVLQKPGYWPWTAADVHVASDCGTKTVFLDVRLRPRVP